MIRLCLPFLLTLLFASFTLSAQQLNYNQTEPFLKANSYWAWYDNNGLDFSGGTPIHNPTGLFPAFLPPAGGFWREGLSSASDPVSGDLLFYTDGRRVFNSSNSLMSNGDSLFGNFNGTAIQGSCIVPVIGESGKYYVFSMGTTPEDNAYKGLYYSVVDMSRDNGNGEIVPNSKNIVVDTSITFNEAMVAIPGNNCNVWLLTHEAESKSFRAYEISASGLNTTPVISEGLYTTGHICYHLSVSPDRSKVMMTDLTPPIFYQIANMTPNGLGPAQYSELANFDPNTGMVSNSIPIVPQFIHPSVPGTDTILYCGTYTSAFSPNSEFIYLTQRSYTTGNHALLIQMDISVHDSFAVNNSHLVIDTLMTEGPEFSASLKSYNDSIYVFYSGSDKIGRINQPDNAGQLCDYDSDAIQLPSPYVTNVEGAAVINEVVYPSGAVNELILDTVICSSYTLKPAFTSDETQYTWSDSTSGSTLIIDEPGIYWVSYEYFHDNCITQRTDSFYIESAAVSPPPQITNISADVLGTSGSYVNYQWMLNGNLINGATSSTYQVSENGEYQVIVSNEYGCTDTSGIYEVTNRETGIYALSNSDEVRIYPNPATEKVYIESNQEINFQIFQINGKAIGKLENGTVLNVANLSAGLYLLKIYDKSGRLLRNAKVSKL